jgi:hypothetical protein
VFLQAASVVYRFEDVVHVAYHRRIIVVGDENDVQVQVLGWSDVRCVRTLQQNALHQGPSPSMDVDNQVSPLADNRQSFRKSHSSDEQRCQRPIGLPVFCV